MAQTSAAWSSAHALDLYSSSSNTLSVHAGQELMTPVSEDTSAGRENATLFKGAFFRAISELKYTNKLKIAFVVTEGHRPHFVVIKGIIEFHRFADMVFSYNKTDGTFEVTTAWQKREDLYKFLGKISLWIDQELSFKRQLKQMMAFEREYRAKLAKVYAGGDGFTLLR